MKTCDVSISIVSYNTKDYISRCIDSIKKYTHGVSYEIIVTDNASIDGTPNYLQRKYNNVKVIRNKTNKFYGGANNQALKIAKGNYFLILNADTYFKDNSIKKIVTFMNKFKDIGAVEGLEIYENGELVPNGSLKNTPILDFYELSFIGKRLKNIDKIKKFRLTHKNRKDTFDIEVGCDAFLVVRKNLLSEIGGYDERLRLYYTENDVCNRILERGFRVVHYGKAYVYHKVSVSANKLKWKKLDLYYSDLYTYYKINNQAFLGTLLYIDLKIEKWLLQIFRPNMFES